MMKTTWVLVVLATSQNGVSVHTQSFQSNFACYEASKFYNDAERVKGINQIFARCVEDNPENITPPLGDASKKKNSE